MRNHRLLFMWRTIHAPYTISAGTLELSGDVLFAIFGFVSTCSNVINLLNLVSNSRVLI